MSWYGAHIILYLKPLEVTQESYDMLENIVLVEAETSDAAWAAAEKLGKKYETGLVVGPEDRPASWVYAGIRALVECQDSDPETLEQPSDFRPAHATEISYLYYTVENSEALNRLLNGKSVEINLEDNNPLTAEEREELFKYYPDRSSANLSSNPRINRLLRILP